MRRPGLVSLIVLFAIAASPCRSQATPTRLSGDDTDQCRRTAPCKTFAGAISMQRWTAATFASGKVRGFNQPDDVSAASLSAMAATGANFFRYFVTLSPNTGNVKTYTSFVYDSAALARVISTAAPYGLKVVVVLEDPNRANIGYNMWNGPAAPSIRASLLSIWKQVASAYKKNDNIAAYDLLNEPVVGDGSNSQENQNSWRFYSATLIRAIRSIDADHAIIMETTPWDDPVSYGSTFTRVMPFDNLVYSIHTYHPYCFTNQGLPGYSIRYIYPGDVCDFPGDPLLPANSSTIANINGLSGVIDFQASTHVPVYVGEFSAARYAPIARNRHQSSDNWLKDLIEIFEYHKWAWGYHAWRNWYGWDSDVPYLWYQKFPYVDAMPQWDGSPIPRSAATSTMLLLKQYFKLNK